MAYACPEIWLANAINSATGFDAHPVMAPEDAVFPFVVYKRAATERPVSVNPLTGPTPTCTMELMVYTRSYTQGKDIAEQLRFALCDFTGNASGVTITSVMLVSQSDGEAEPREGETIPDYVQELTFEIRYME